MSARVRVRVKVRVRVRVRRSAGLELLAHEGGELRALELRGRRRRACCCRRALVRGLLGVLGGVAAVGRLGVQLERRG